MPIGAHGRIRVPSFCGSIAADLEFDDTELVVEALATAFQDLDRWEEHTDTLTKLLENYLSEARHAPKQAVL
jgi:glucose-6-phosphate isomerase